MVSKPREPGAKQLSKFLKPSSDLLKYTALLPLQLPCPSGYNTPILAKNIENFLVLIKI
jgi:hypothetical protein